jgi:hypothetical protein
MKTYGDVEVKPLHPAWTQHCVGEGEQLHAPAALSRESSPQNKLHRSPGASHYCPGLYSEEEILLLPGIGPRPSLHRSDLPRLQITDNANVNRPFCVLVYRPVTMLSAARCNVVCCGGVVVGVSLFRIPWRSLQFSIYLLLPVAVAPWVGLSP